MSIRFRRATARELQRQSHRHTGADGNGPVGKHSESEGRDQQQLVAAVGSEPLTQMLRFLAFLTF